MQDTMQNHDIMQTYANHNARQLQSTIGTMLQGTMHDTMQNTMQDTMQDTMHDTMQDTTQDTMQNTMHSTMQNTEETYEYSWPEQFYYFALFRTLNGPDTTPGKDCADPIDSDTYYTQADLSAWIRSQNASRKAFLDGKPTELTANQIKVLDGVGFPWVRDSSERWDGHFQELVEYKEKHGHCNVPRRSCKLGIWVKNQRAAYHKLCDIAAGREMDPNVKRTTAVITPDQIKLLTDLGFQWKIREDHGITWDAHFENLKAFKEQHGHTRVSPKEVPALGRWVAELRRQHKRKARGERWRITEEQFARLNEVGFEWQRPAVDPEERKRRKQESDRKQNEKKKRKRQEAKKQRQKEAHAVLKKYLPQAKKMDGASATEKSGPKKGAGARRKKAKGCAGKPGAEECEAIAVPAGPSVDRIKNDIDQKLAELRREEEDRARKLRKVAEDHRKSGRLVVSSIVKLAAGAPADEGAEDGATDGATDGVTDGAGDDLAGENKPKDEETGESPCGSAISNAVKLETDEGSADEARNRAEEGEDLADQMENEIEENSLAENVPAIPDLEPAKLGAENAAIEEPLDDRTEDLIQI